ncbi:hypothetical protein [Clostridium sp.]|uniref:hypothetical protein n=1 Tax=Clostridium sp. TaxID=1506 RepID=UPI003F3AFF48
MKIIDSICSYNFSVRKIIALSVTGVFCYLSIRGIVKSNEFIPIFSMIIGYYFGKSTALDAPPNALKKQNTQDSKNNNVENTVEENQ